MIAAASPNYLALGAWPTRRTPMLSRNQLSASIAAILCVFHFGMASCDAADRNRSFDSGQPLDLINRPVCWSSEQPDPSRNCDFAQKP